MWGCGRGMETRSIWTQLAKHIPRIYNEFRPGLIYYLAGADPYDKDQLGGLELSWTGLMQRDHLIIESARIRRIPMVVVLAGG